MPRKKKPDLAPVEIRPSEEWKSPHDEYVYNLATPGLDEVATRWGNNKIPGLSRSNIFHKANLEKWTDQRKEFQSSLKLQTEQKIHDRLSDEMSEVVLEANRRHATIGQKLQTIGLQCVTKKATAKGDRLVFENPVSKEDYFFKSVSETLRSISLGVEIERRALGLADQVVQVKLVRDIIKSVADCVTKYIDDPVVLDNLMRDFEEIVRKSEENLEDKIGSQLPKRDLH